MHFFAVRIRGQSPKCYLHNHSMDHHPVAGVSIAGTCLDVLGSLYLAYDWLGWANGPLRLLTGAVIYSIVFGIDRPFLNLFPRTTEPVDMRATPIHPLDHCPIGNSGYFAAVIAAFFRAAVNSGRSSPTEIWTNSRKYRLATVALPLASAALAAPYKALNRFGAIFRTASYSASAS